MKLTGYTRKPDSVLKKQMIVTDKGVESGGAE